MFISSNEIFIYGMDRKKCSSACGTHLSQILEPYTLALVVYNPVTKSGFPLITIPSAGLPPFHTLP